MSRYELVTKRTREAYDAAYEIICGDPNEHDMDQGMVIAAMKALIRMFQMTVETDAALSDESMVGVFGSTESKVVDDDA